MYKYILFFSVLLFSSCSFLEDSLKVFNQAEQEIIVVDSNELNRNCVIASYTSQIGVKEVGNNRGEDVEKYLKSVGLGGGYAWCAAFVSWNFQVCGINTGITAWSPTAFVKSKETEEPQQGDVFTLYYPNLKRIGHTGFYDGRHNEIYYNSVEGNTSGSGSREGDGVYRMKRSYKATFGFCDFIIKMDNRN